MIADRSLFSDRSRVVATKFAVVAAVFLLSALLALLTPGGILAYLLIALAPAAVIALFILQRLPLFLLLAVAAGLLVPFSLGTGTETGLNPVILLLPIVSGLWVLDMALRQKSIRLHRHPAVTLLLAFCAAAILAFIAGQLPWFSIPGAGLAAQVGGLMVFLLSAVAFLLAAHVLNERWLGRLVYLFIAIGGVYVLGRLTLPFGALILRLFDGGATASAFWTWLVALSAGLALFHRALKPHWRFVLAAVAVATLGVGFFLDRAWASGWAPPAVALLILIWLRLPRWGWIPVVAAAVFFFLQLDQFWSLTTDGESWWARRQAWQIVLETTRINPLLGLGPSNYYFYVQQADIGGWGGNWNVRFSSHNNWVDLIAQTGLIGTAVFLLFAFSMGRVAWGLYRRLPAGFTRGYAAACFAGLIATLISGMLGDWFLPFVYNIGLSGLRSSILFWVFLGGLLALYVRQDK
jgi:O-antigen ligase